MKKHSFPVLLTGSINFKIRDIKQIHAMLGVRPELKQSTCKIITGRGCGEFPDVCQI